MRVRQFELRLIALALAISWAVAGALVLIAYRPGGPLDVLVGVTLLGPIAIAALGVVWPPVVRGAAAFPAMISLGLGSLLLLLPSMAGVFEQLRALGSQTLLPSLEAAYPWLLALVGTSLFSGFGIARRWLGAAALRPRRFAAGVAMGTTLTIVAGATFTGVAVANEIALRDRPAPSVGSRFGPTQLDGVLPACDGELSAGATARVSTSLTASIDLRPIGSVEQAGSRAGDSYRWLAYVATDRELGWYGAAWVDGLAWFRRPDRGWTQTAPADVADATVDLRAITYALTAGFRATAEDRGTEVLERAPARRCRVAVDGATFTEAFPQVRWLVGDADLGDWRGQLDFWVFLDGQIGQIAGNLNGGGSVVEAEAIQGSIEVLLTATERDRDVVIYPPPR